MSNLTKRILSALVLIPIILSIIFFSNSLVFTGFIALFAAYAGFEYGKISLGKELITLSYLTGFCSAILALSISSFSNYPWLLLVACPFVSIIVPLSFMFTKVDFSFSVRSMAFAYAGPYYCGILMGFIGLIFTSHINFGPYWVLLLLVGTFMGDTGAYTFGRLFGKSKFSPRLSPKKTWAGAIGGLFTTIFSIALIKYLFIADFSWILLFGLGFCLSIFCQLGDLTESFLKRGIGVKDSGNIIPGHGGFLDRVDALLFGAPVVYLFSILN